MLARSSEQRELMSSRARSTLIVLSVVQAVTLAQAAELAAVTDSSVAISRTRRANQRAMREIPPGISSLDRVAYAVDGAESSHGEDLAMWGPDPSGPQGPMQVSAAAAADVGGGDRFDLTENRAIGRAYLAQLYRRYRNWPDAIAAYNWGMGNLDNWIQAGRPADKLVVGVAAYLRRVLRDSGMCGASAARVRLPAASTPSGSGHPREIEAKEVVPEFDPFALAVCIDLDSAGRVLEGQDRHSFEGFGRFYNKLEKAMQLVARHLPKSSHSEPGFGRTTVSWNDVMRKPRHEQRLTE
jgi:hypothetical protein